jgi:hypothetical protein
MSLYTTLSVEIVGTFCGYGLKDNHGVQNHNQSIKRGCLVQFIIR